MRSYTLHYKEPALVGQNPVQFEYEFDVYHFNAKDFNQAMEIAAAFLAQRKVSSNNKEAKREGVRLIQDFPYHVMHNFAPDNKVRAVA